VEQIYKRAEDIDEKVKDARLPYQEWKVLFLLGEKSEATEISSLLSEDSSSVSNIFESLESKGLIEKVSDDQELADAEVATDESPVSSLGDELLMVEDEIVEEGEAQAEPEAEQQEEAKPDEVTTEILNDDKIEVNTDFFNEDLLPKDEIPKTESSKIDKLEESPAPSELEAAKSEFDLSLDEDVVGLVEESPAEVESEEQPPQAEADHTEELPTEEETISDVSKKTIMVIDDSIVIRKMIEIALEDEDFNIVTAISGKEGLENIEIQQPNLVILDMMLPDMNGIDVLKTIKSNNKLPVIMLSGKDSPQLIESAKEFGVDDFLPKPFRDEELVEKVRTLVGA